MGLRERKKARTRAAIRTEAMRLFRERGYAATTIEQIAAAADISPATFFRYYPTKEDVVLQDDFDVLMPEAVETQPPSLGPIAAVRATFTQALSPMGPVELSRLQETIEPYRCGCEMAMAVKPPSLLTASTVAASIRLIQSQSTLPCGVWIRLVCWLIAKNGSVRMLV